MKWAIKAGAILNPEGIAKDTVAVISGEMIENTGKSVNSNIPFVDIPEGVLCPGLINSHDHLIGNYYPKVGNGPYESWLPWDNDLKSAPVYRERQQIENRDLYLLGTYRNLISGVTTVSDHIPKFVAEPYYDYLPMKPIKNYYLAHSIGSSALAWGGEIADEYAQALANNAPFVTHIAEGFDLETLRDVDVLEKRGGLGSHSVLVHGISFSPENMDKIKKVGASVVWCGDSNMFMFNKTANIKMLLDKGINVCIGTDSPMSGGANLLEEIRFDKKLYKELTGKELSDSQIFKMITENPVKAFKLHDNGKVKKGCRADLVVFRDTHGKNPTSVVNARLQDVRLVVIDGNPAYADAEFDFLFNKLKINYEKITVEGIPKIIIGNLTGLLQRISRAVGFKKTYPFLPVEFDF